METFTKIMLAIRIGSWILLWLSEAAEDGVITKGEVQDLVDRILMQHEFYFEFNLPMSTGEKDET